MIKQYESLSEKIEGAAQSLKQKLGYGGVSYIYSLFMCDDKTVKRQCP